MIKIFRQIVVPLSPFPPVYFLPCNLLQLELGYNSALNKNLFKTKQFEEKFALLLSQVRLVVHKQLCLRTAGCFSTSKTSSQLPGAIPNDHVLVLCVLHLQSYSLLSDTPNRLERLLVTRYLYSEAPLPLSSFWLTWCCVGIPLHLKCPWSSGQYDVVLCVVSSRHRYQGEG